MLFPLCLLDPRRRVWAALGWFPSAPSLCLGTASHVGTSGWEPSRKRWEKCQHLPSLVAERRATDPHLPFLVFKHVLVFCWGHSRKGKLWIF